MSETLDPPVDVELNLTRRGAGEPLVLLHGIGSERCVWDPVLDDLARDFEVFAIDLPGFGHSPALPDHVTPTPAALADAVAAQLARLGHETFHAVGNSLGGWVALELGRTGVARTVTGVCPAGLWGVGIAARNLENGPPMTRGPARRAARALRPVIPVLMAAKPARRAVLQFFVAHPDRVPRKAATEMVVSYGRGSAYEATSYAMRSSRLERAEEIRVPVTLGWGARDRLLQPARLDAPDVVAVGLPDCGHVPMWDAPELVTALIRRGVGRGR